MRIEIIINDQTIRNDIRYVIDRMIEDEEITFKDDLDYQEFTDDCFDEIASKVECYDYFPGLANIRDTVEQMASDRE